MHQFKNRFLNYYYFLLRRDTKLSISYKHQVELSLIYIKVTVIIGILFLCHWFMRNTSLKEVSLKISPLILGLFWAVMLFLIIISQGMVS